MNELIYLNDIHATLVNIIYHDYSVLATSHKTNAMGGPTQTTPTSASLTLLQTCCTSSLLEM